MPLALVGTIRLLSLESFYLLSEFGAGMYYLEARLNATFARTVDSCLLKPLSCSLYLLLFVDLIVSDVCLRKFR